MMSRIDSRHWKISTGRHFQNGRHNMAKIQHCPISSKFDMWVDNDVPNWFPTLKISTGRHFQNSSLSDFNAISYVGRFFFLWCPELVSDIEKFLPVAIFKMPTTISHKIQHCPISTTFHMWVDYDVPNLFPTFKIF